MSQQREENIEIVRRTYERWAAGDFQGTLADLDPHVMLVVRQDFPEFGVFTGPDGVRTFTQRWFEPWERVTVEARNLRAVGDTVLARVVQRGKGRASGIEGDVEYFQLWSFRGGRIIRLEVVMTENEAREAAGLQEEPVSEENVEIVRRVYEAAVGRDAAAVLALYDPEVRLDVSRLEVHGAPGGVRGIYHGHKGLRSVFGEWHETYGEIEYDYDELIDAGEQVISVVTRHARGRASGAEVEQPFALVWTIRDGKVVEVVWFLTRAEALEAAGLSE